MTIGAGRVVYQELSRIDRSIADGSFACNPAIRSVTTENQANALHIFGLLSPGGVHSHENHIFKAIELAVDNGREVFLHAILDGRDTPPMSATKSLQRVMRLEQDLNNFHLVSISGRYYAMDRDNRWERTQQAYDLYTGRTSRYQYDNGLQALQEAYKRGETDEFVLPTQIGKQRSVRNGDDILMMNFRADRVRQMTRAFTNPSGSVGFERHVRPRLNQLVCLTPYASDITGGCDYVKHINIAFGKVEITDTFAAVVARSNKTQLRIAETEKYAHVTYFFSGGSETEEPGESRRFVASPNVATYDLQPEMSADQITNEVVTAIREFRFDVIVCNFANADMVGHTGNFEAAVKAVEYLDTCLGRITTATLNTGSHCLITADHGNVEEMLEPASKQPHTAHTTGVVPLIYVGNAFVDIYQSGSLKDVAPTLLKVMNIEQPVSMTGRSLLH